MNIGFICNKKSFECCCSTWNRLRNICVMATFAYLTDFLAHEIFDEYDQPVANELQDFMQTVKKKANELATSKYKMRRQIDETSNDCLLESLIINVSANAEFGDWLIKFGAAGIYALCNKTDSVGYYSVGNSVDICDLLNKIIEFMPINDKIFANEFLEVFMESVNKKMPVSIY
jgi:hypothetical protein